MDTLEMGAMLISEDHNSDSSFENSADEGYDADIDLPCRKVQVGSAPACHPFSSVAL